MADECVRARLQSGVRAQWPVRPIAASVGQRERTDRPLSRPYHSHYRAGRLYRLAMEYCHLVA